MPSRCTHPACGIYGSLSGYALKDLSNGAQKQSWPMLKPIQPGKTILLFYKEFEADKFFKYDRYLKRILRPIYHRLHRRQKKSGFSVSFDLMCRALEKAGYDVRINDYRSAQNNPDYPVGLIGFPVLLDSWKLQNPA